MSVQWIANSYGSDTKTSLYFYIRITLFRLVDAATTNKFLWIDDAWVTGYLGIEK